MSVHDPSACHSCPCPSLPSHWSWRSSASIFASLWKEMRFTSWWETLRSPTFARRRQHAFRPQSQPSSAKKHVFPFPSRVAGLRSHRRYQRNSAPERPRRASSDRSESLVWFSLCRLRMYFKLVHYCLSLRQNAAPVDGTWLK